EETHEAPELHLRGRDPEPQDDDPGVLGRRISPRIGEIEIEGDETAPLATHCRGQIDVGTAAKLLVVDREDIVAPAGEGGLSIPVDVFVELDPHEDLTSGTILSVASLAP